MALGSRLLLLLLLLLSSSSLSSSSLLLSLLLCYYRYRANTILFHEHVRTILSVHLTMVVVRVAYILATKPYIDPRKNRFAFVPSLYVIIVHKPAD